MGLIDRQQAIDAIAQCTNCGDEDTLREYVLKHSLDNGWTGGILEALDAVKNLPPAQPEPKEGQWVNGCCNKCGGHAPFWAMASTYYKSDFCPHCGAKMKGAEHETN
jgi:DNA-directed RNA polymerase subunit M/transcription elongation factor TFIIS